jgi:hypothetical protein
MSEAFDDHGDVVPTRGAIQRTVRSVAAVAAPRS